MGATACGGGIDGTWLLFVDITQDTQGTCPTLAVGTGTNPLLADIVTLDDDSVVVFSAELPHELVGTFNGRRLDALYASEVISYRDDGSYYTALTTETITARFDGGLVEGEFFDIVYESWNDAPPTIDCHVTQQFDGERVRGAGDDL